MVKSWKRKIVPTLLAGTMALSFGGVVSADSWSGKGHGKANAPGQVKKYQKQFKTKRNFHDVKDHWAKDVIERMAAYEILNGYTDSTFRPNKPVTQLEAVTVVMNLLEQSVDDLKTNGDDYIGKVPAWAKEDVELAIYNDIVDWEDMKQFNKPASRMFVVNLLVNALEAGDEDALDDLLEERLFFVDIDDLDSKEKAYLAVAIEYALVEGYGDKTFKPNKPVTRGEMATFVSRLFDKVEFDFDDDDRDKDDDDNSNRFEFVSGTIKNFDKDDDELRIDSKTYEISDDLEVRISGKEADFDDLKSGMDVTAVLDDDDEIIKLFVNLTNAYKKEVDFKIVKVNDVDFEEAKLIGDRVRDDTPNLSKGELFIRLNDTKQRAINLEEIDGRQDDGDEVADELEDLIEEALDDDRVKVSFENSRFIFETEDSPRDEVPMIQFDGDEDVLDALGIEDDVVKGAFDRVSWKIIVEDDAEKDETYELEIEVETNDDEFEEEIEFLVDKNDTAEEIAEKIAAELKDNKEIKAMFNIRVKDNEVTLTAADVKKIEVEIDIDTK